MLRFLALFPLLLLVFTAPALAQEGESDYVPLTSFPDQHRTRIFGDKVNVRAGAASDAAVVAQLVAGTPVTIRSRSETEMTLNGWTAPWYRIAFEQGGRSAEGYVWGGLLSPSAFFVNGVSFVYGIARAQKPAGEEESELLENEIEFRAVRNGEIISTARAKMAFHRGYIASASLKTSLGLKNVRQALLVEFSGEACGYTNYEAWCLWDGSRLTLLPVLESVADGGVFFDSESYIFPENEGGLPDKLLYVHEHGESGEEDGVSDFTRVTRPMIWNGKTYVKPKIVKK